MWMGVFRLCIVSERLDEPFLYTNCRFCLHCRCSFRCHIGNSIGPQIASIVTSSAKLVFDLIERPESREHHGFSRFADARGFGGLQLTTRSQSKTDAAIGRPCECSSCWRQDSLGKVESLALRHLVLLLGTVNERFKIELIQTRVRPGGHQKCFPEARFAMYPEHQQL